jgi:ParB family transcriptional regulator, chromosome partitioning protein
MPKKEASMTPIIQTIPLTKLIPSKSNVRRTARYDGIAALAASIKAHGLLQNLTVKKSGDVFEVVAGGRRLAALRALAKRRQLAKNIRIPCRVLADESSEELSLAENVLQCPMHPADQYEAFAKLHAEQGMSAEDIAARFGITPAVVRQRLKLSAVSPKLMTLYRAGEISLDQLSAFAITDDHDKQERVWAELPPFNRSRAAILRALNAGHVPGDDRRARFVGAKAYQKAGGAISRDLFDPEGAGFFTDADLLNRLVREKLQGIAGEITAEGWKWVTISPDLDHDAIDRMRRVYPQAAALTRKQEAKRERLSHDYDALIEQHQHDGEVPEDVAERLEALEAEIEAVDGPSQYRPEDLAVAGAFICVGHGGEPHIERGYVRAEDEASVSGGASTGEDGTVPAAKLKGALSDRLIAELTAYRTAALRDTLAQRPVLALSAVTHALAASVFYGPGEHSSCLEIVGRSAALSVHAEGIAESPAEQRIATRHEAWAARLPQEPERLWDFVSGLANGERLELLAHCASLSVNAVRVPHGQVEGEATRNADTLVKALNLDMSQYWSATAGSYFGRVSKERIVEAVREGASEDAARRIAGLKKQEMVAAAEQALAGKGWLPPLLRFPDTPPALSGFGEDA